MAEPTPPQHHPGLRLIAVIKLIKAVLLLVVGFGSLRLLNRDLSETAQQLARHLSIDPENRFVHWAVLHAARVEPSKLRHFGEMSLFFAVDQIVEGLGLWYNQAWAKYLLLVVTPVFLAIESYHLGLEIVHHAVSGFRVLSVAVAAALLVYLVWILRMDRRRAAKSCPAAP